MERAISPLRAHANNRQEACLPETNEAKIRKASKTNEMLHKKLHSLSLATIGRSTPEREAGYADEAAEIAEVVAEFAEVCRTRVRLQLVRNQGEGHLRECLLQVFKDQ